MQLLAVIPTLAPPGHTKGYGHKAMANKYAREHPEASGYIVFGYEDGGGGGVGDHYRIDHGHSYATSAVVCNPEHWEKSRGI